MNDIKIYVTGLVTGFLALSMLEYLGNISAAGKTIPRTENVQQEYIAPSKLEIECEDLDGNGEPETTMKISDSSYLLKYVNGKPVLLAYDIKPAKVIPKEPLTNEFILKEKKAKVDSIYQVKQDSLKRSYENDLEKIMMEKK